MSADGTTWLVFLDVALVIALAGATGSLFARLGQPRVIGEIVAGIALGPTLLGALPGDLTGLLFAHDVRASLGVIGQLALALFMFLVGWDMNLRVLGANERTAATISLLSASVPFGLGAALAVVLYQSHGVVDGHAVGIVPFALFIGASMSITAFPVLARILVERGMERGRLGTLVLACAAFDDALGWILVVVVLAVVTSAEPWEWTRMLVELAVFLLVVGRVIKPALARVLEPGRGRIQCDVQATTAVLVAGALACAGMTELIGLHFVLGTFAFGLAVPRGPAEVVTLDRARRGIAPLVAVLLPAYFVLPGLSVDLSSLHARDALELAAIMVVACAGKLGGALAGARLRHVEWRTALAIGALMNTRGLIEIVVLTIGLEHGVLDRRLFTIMVLMAIGTTLMTGPALSRIYRNASPRGADGTEVAPVSPALAHSA
jgi:Kef-type K+ transport system membrane component KefB